MDNTFTTVIQTLVAEQGKETLFSASKCKAFLADYTKGEHKKESRLLLQAIEAGVAEALSNADDLASCKAQAVQKLQDEYFLAENIAQDVVDMLAAVLTTPKAEETAVEAAPKCGKELVEGAKFCANCGAAVGEGAVVVAEAEVKRLTQARDQSNNEKRIAQKAFEKVKSVLIAAIVIGVIGIAISIGVGVSQYNSIIYDYNVLYYDNNTLKPNYDALTSDYDALKVNYNALTYDYDVLQSEYNALNSDNHILKTFGDIHLSTLKIGNWNNNQWLTVPGNQLRASQIRYLRPQITYSALTAKQVTFFIKIISPGGIVDRNASISPVGYTYDLQVRLSRGINQTLNLAGWGNSDNSAYQRGDWRIEVWLDSVCTGQTTVTLN
jgi:hypothetical protein